MIVLLGCVLGIGVVLVAAPFLWPAGRRRERDRERHGGTLLRTRLNQAGLSGVPVAGFVVVSALFAMVVGCVLLVSLGVVTLAVAGAATAAVLPFMGISARAAARRRAHRAQWPDAVDQLVSAVRSGLGLPDALASLARTGPASTRVAFAGFEHDFATTGHFGRSLDKVKGELADPTADRILETLRMARDVGGSDLTRVLRGLASSLRQDAAVRSELSARQSWVANAARLGVAAPWIVLLLLAGRPEAAQAYNSPSGIAVIVIGLAVSLIAYRIMRAVGRLPEEKRWFG